VEEHGEVEEEAEQICPICYDAVDGSKSCRFACCMQKNAEDVDFTAKSGV
jgi:hypothetical protein